MLALIEIIAGFLARLFPPKSQKVKEESVDFLVEATKRQEARKAEEKNLDL